MQKMTGVDAAFLYLETPSAHMHVIGVVILEKATMLSGRSAADIHDKRISAVTDYAWYRVRSEHLRGAVWIDKSGVTWLCVLYSSGNHPAIGRIRRRPTKDACCGHRSQPDPWQARWDASPRS